MAEEAKPKARKAASGPARDPRKRVKLSDDTVAESDDDETMSSPNQHKTGGKLDKKASKPTKAVPCMKKASKPKVKTEIKVEAGLKSGETNGAPKPKKDPKTYGWKACSDENLIRKLEIKEEAVLQGLIKGQKVEIVLRKMLESQPEDTTAGSSSSDISNWLRQFEDVKIDHSQFRVFIGFAGVTGAGKTSAINSIIGFRDLLPSSNEAAATAVPCLIAYNDDPSPQKAFRAEVIFRERDDIKGVLDKYFESRQNARQSAGIVDDDSGEDARQDEGNTTEGACPSPDMEEEAENQDLLEMISEVFGLDENELDKENTDSLLAKNPDVLKLLGETVPVSGSDPEVFSEAIKPYMDSVHAVHGDTGVEFAVWPLIKEVRVFVRSDVLKNGVVLVDLPGFSDNVESRASVARDYLRKLSVTAIVTPIVRALNEQTGVQLMTESQELSMKMDGKFHKNSFCVILSKMDDINIATYIKQHSLESNADQAFQGYLAQITSLRKELAELKAKKAALMKQSRDNSEIPDPQIILELDLLISRNRDQGRRMDGRVHHWCIQSRNSLVMDKIRQDFAKRQKRLLVASKRHDLYDGNVSMFPISSSAFWKIKEGGDSPVGFPTAQYSGIPAAAHWLRYATVPDREKHLDRVLNTLQGLFNMMNTWSCNQGKKDLELDKKFVEDEILHMPLFKLQKNLGTAFISIRRDIKALDPMKNKDTTVADCKNRCVDVVQRWAFTEPHNRRCRKKVQWSTYSACVRRYGRPFQSHAKGRPRFAWIESLCNLFYEGIVNEWNSVLNEEIPALANPALRIIEGIWTTFLEKLQARVNVAAPELERLFLEQYNSFEQIKEEIKDQVSKKFEAISVGAQKIHRNISKSVQEKMEPGFNKAQKEAGVGMLRRMQEHLIARTKLKGTNMFKDSADDVEKQLKAQLNSLKKEFDEVIANALSRVKQHMSLMLDNAKKQVDDESLGQLAPGSKERAQKLIRKILSEWQAQWCFGDFVDLTVEAMDVAIPERYYEVDEMEEILEAEQAGSQKEEAGAETEGTVVEEEDPGVRIGGSTGTAAPKDAVGSKADDTITAE